MSSDLLLSRMPRRATPSDLLGISFTSPISLQCGFTFEPPLIYAKADPSRELPPASLAFSAIVARHVPPRNTHHAAARGKQQESFLSTQADAFQLDLDVRWILLLDVPPHHHDTTRLHASHLDVAP